MISSHTVFVVIGGTGGIGSATAQRLREGGAEVAIAARDAGRVAELARERDSRGVPADAARVAEVERVLAETKERYGRLDGVVNCAGAFLFKPAHATSEEEWHRVLEANLTTAFATVRAAARAFDGGGSIVLLTSAAARVGFANHEAIAAAKAGVIGLTLSAAATYASRGVRVNAVAPGLTSTPATERIVSGPGGEASRAMHPLGRLGEPDDVASAIVWLLDPSQSWVTGQVIGVDGGISTVRPRA
jgi:3-oxoacyl-[acyl-carrier protein] reductase